MLILLLQNHDNEVHIIYLELIFLLLLLKGAHIVTYKQMHEFMLDEDMIYII